MQTSYEVVIVGGGVSGAACAIELTRGKTRFNGENVLIAERNDRLLKKLTATGNGQGNLTNSSLGARDYHGNENFIRGFFAEQEDLKGYFESLGVPIVYTESGKAYPASKQASAVTDALRAHLESADVKTVTGAKVMSVKKEKDVFIVKTDKAAFTAKRVVLAFGGAAAKQFGTDGTSYNLATELGHGLTDLKPSIVQLKTEREPIKGLKGIKACARVTLFDGAKPIKSATGDVLFTEYGVSGSAIFSISSYLWQTRNPYIKTEFLPEFDIDATESALVAAARSPLYKINPYACVVNKKIGEALYKTVRDKSVKSLAYALKNFTLKVTGTLGFDSAQTTHGGINADEIDYNSMESKLIKNLYIIGEALDVDGDCGGYNLSFAFLSGVKAANSIKNSIKNELRK